MAQDGVDPAVAWRELDSLVLLTFERSPLVPAFFNVRKIRCSARLQLVQTSSDFDFPAMLPANVRYVGPVLDDPLWAETPWNSSRLPT
jgi:hypothetical protein